MRVRVGGIEFDGGDGDSSPFTIVENGLHGWLEGTTMRRDQLDRAAAHGAFPAPGYLAGRVITIDGELYTDGPIRQEYELARLSGLLADGGSSLMEVDQADKTLRADVSRNDAPDVDLDMYGLLAKFQIQFWSPDPRRYGAPRTFGPGTVIPVNHLGNFPALPSFKVRGNWPSGYTIVGPNDEMFIVTLPLIPGNEHVVDFATARVSMGDRVQIGAVLRPQTFTVPAGRTVTTALVGAGSGEMDVLVPPTFV